MSQPRNPQRRIDTPLNFSFMERDQSLTEKQDFKINIKPYVDEGYYVEARGEHRAGAFMVTGWMVTSNPSNLR